MQRWKFYDPTTTTETEFILNPRDGGLPQWEKTVTAQGTTAPANEGNIVIFEGTDKPSTVAFSGTLIYQEHHQFFLDWFQKRYQVRITDDLGNVVWCYLTKYSPKRKNRVNYKWTADYDAEALILDWELP